MSEPGGPESYLRVPKARADRAEHRVVGYHDPVEVEVRVAAVDRSIDGVNVVGDPDAGVSMGARNMVAPAGPSHSGVRAMMIANAAPSAPEMKRFRPEIDQPLSTRVAVVRIISGSDPAPGCGSVIAKQDRAAPEASGAR